MFLKKKLNLFDTTLLVVGNMAGPGIFTTPGFLAGELNNPRFFIGIWIVGGILTLCGAFTCAEMAGMFSRSGGGYLYLKTPYIPWAGFLLNWICFRIMNPGSVDVLAIALVKYLTGFFGHSGLIGEKLTALIVVIFFFIVNCRGVRLTGTTQNFRTIGSLARLIIFIIGGLASGKGDWRHFTGGDANVFPVSKLPGPAMIAVVFSYSGWEMRSYYKQQKSLPTL